MTLFPGDIYEDYIQLAHPEGPDAHRQQTSYEDIPGEFQDGTDGRNGRIEIARNAPYDHKIDTRIRQ